MSTPTVERTGDWNSVPFAGGYAGLRDLSDDDFSGMVTTGPTRLFMLRGAVVGILDGDIEDFEEGGGTAREAPHPALPLLAVMQERSDEVRAKYYTEETPLSEVDRTLADGNFTGFIELAENVLSGDYYQVYHQGRSMSVAYVGASERLITDDEAFEQADDEVGIYEVRPVDVEIVEIPEPEDDGGAGDAAAAGGAASATDADSDAIDDVGATDDEVVETTEEVAGETTEEVADETDDDPADGGGTDAGRAAGSDASPAAGSDTTQATHSGGADPTPGASAGSDPPAAVEEPSTDRDEPSDDATVADDAAAATSPAATADTETTDESPTAGGETTEAADETARDSGPGPSDAAGGDVGGSVGDATGSAGGGTSSGTSPSTESASAESATSTAATSSGTTDAATDQRSTGTAAAEERAGGPQQGQPAPDHPAASGRAGSDGATNSGATADDRSEEAISAGDLEIRSLPSLDPAKTASASRQERERRSASATGGAAGTSSAQQAERSRTPGRSQQSQSESGSQPVAPDETSDPSQRAAGADQAEGETGADQQPTDADADATTSGEQANEGTGSPQATPENTESSDGASGADVEEARAEVERLEGELADLRGDHEAVVEERDRLQTELAEAREEIDRLRVRLEDAADQGTEASQQLSPRQAIDETNLFIRYDSKGEATLEKAHAGEVDKDAVDANMRLEYHTSFDAADAAVDGVGFDPFLTDTVQYRFVDWLVRKLLYEIRDTGNTGQMGELYDALPEVDRAELNGQVGVQYTENGEEHRAQVGFDVIVRDRMGNPLIVANLNDSRDPATDSMMTDLVRSAERVGESSPSLAGAFLVTRSFFEPEALETAEEATAGGLLNRGKQKSFVNLSRKGGYHLCLVEARNQEFHLAVPEL